MLAHKCVSSSDSCAKYAIGLYPDDPSVKGTLLPKKVDSNIADDRDASSYPSCRPEEISFVENDQIQNLVRKINETKDFKAYYASVAEKDDPYLCKKHCSLDDPFCEEANGLNALGFNEKIIKGVNLVKMQNGEVGKKQLMEIFNQKHDACNRGNLFFKDGKMTNEGRSDCIASIKVNNTERIEFLFPKKMEAIYHLDSGVGLVFNEKKSPIFIKHNRSGSVLNGALSYLYLSDSRAIARVDNLCIETAISSN